MSLKTVDKSNGISIKIPATASNFGPGYSSLSLALSLYNNFWIEKSGSDYPIIENIGRYGSFIPNNQSNLVYKAAQSLFKHVGYECPGLKIRSVCNIPPKRGLGSSATAIIAGLIAAKNISKVAIDRSEICSLASNLGETPDLVSSALLGGLTMTVSDNSSPLFIKLPFPSDMKIILTIPDFEINSTASKLSFPDSININDALFNNGRIAVLIAMLYSNDLSLFSLGLEDKIHSSILKKKMPALTEISLLAKGSGAYGLSICGEGSSFIIFSRKDSDSLANKIGKVFGRYRIKVRITEVKADMDGTKIE